MADKAKKVISDIKEKKSEIKAKKAEKKAAVKEKKVKIKKAVRNKFKCATTGKHSCSNCGKDIERGNTIRMVHVKYDDGHEDRLSFCSKECRNTYCDKNGIPQ